MSLLTRILSLAILEVVMAGIAYCLPQQRASGSARETNQVVHLDHHAQVGSVIPGRARNINSVPRLATQNP